MKTANALGISADSILYGSVEKSRHIYNNETAAILLGCDDREIGVAADVLKPESLIGILFKKILKGD